MRRRRGGPSQGGTSRSSGSGSMDRSGSVAERGTSSSPRAGRSTPPAARASRTARCRGTATPRRARVGCARPPCAGRRSPSGRMAGLYEPMSDATTRSSISTPIACDRRLQEVGVGVGEDREPPPAGTESAQRRGDVREHAPGGQRLRQGIALALRARRRPARRQHRPTSPPSPRGRGYSRPSCTRGSSRM